MPIFDELCRRMYSFLFSCLNSDSRLIGELCCVATATRSISPIARNAIFCLLHLHMKFSIAAMRNLPTVCLEVDFCRVCLAIFSAVWDV
jgi:hypothetical protein